MSTSDHITPDVVLSFWLDEVGASGWYAADDARDAEIRERFGAAVVAARNGAFREWRDCARGDLALLLLLDQFPRNIWRGEAAAFASDGMARTLASSAIIMGRDREVPEPERQFFYLPLMHSESLPDQERCVRLILTRMPESGANNLPFAIQHRADIRRFGRFPYRNAALGRRDTPQEAAWLADRQG